MTDNETFRGKGAALRIDNLDTDQIMPKQFLRGIDKSGLADGLLYDLRFDTAGSTKQEFVLNRPEHADASILLGGSNFGCGSSREHAVWGLLQYGFRAVIAPSFAEIFYSNAMGNRLLLIPLPVEHVEALMTRSEQGQPPMIVIDVASATVAWDGHAPVAFHISDRYRQMFLEGIDVIGHSLTFKQEILAFAEQHWQRQPWLHDVARRMSARIKAS